MFMRSVGDVAEFLSRPLTGMSETAASPGWRLIRHYFPDVRSVVVRRPINDVVEAVMATNTGGMIVYERGRLRRGMEYLARYLDQISRSPGALTVEFADLDNQTTCRAIFEHCLPCYDFDAPWWAWLAKQNLQTDILSMVLYRKRHLAEINKFKLACRAELRRLFLAGAIQRE